MVPTHLRFWPATQSHSLTVPQTSLLHNLEVSAARYPDKTFLIFYDSHISYRRFAHEVELLAGFLSEHCGVRKGERVLLYLQNSPQFVLAYYAILRLGAVVVPINPMNLTEELRHYVRDTAASVAFVPQDLLVQMQPLLAEGLQHLIVAAYADYLEVPSDLTIPDFVRAARVPLAGPGITLWSAALAAHLQAAPVSVGPDDLCVMPYTSGTTGQPKGCMHTHASVMYNVVASMQWFGAQQDSVALAALPFFHVTGMQGSMNGPLYIGATLVLLARWDRDTAAECIRRYRVTAVQLISTMVVDLLASPRVDEYDLSSLRRISGGGAAMPQAIAQKFQDLLALPYVEGYGMSETIAPTHINPPQRTKQQCLGIPIYDVDARLLDPDTLQPALPGAVGEIIVHGPQVMRGYWNNSAATAAAFIEIDGKRFLRTGDLARIDEDGYFFMVDRLKRMINAAGFKVWPAEVEALMYRHPAIREVCVVARSDARRGETVAAVVVLHTAMRGLLSEQDLIDWAHQNMAAYKSPRSIIFREALPKSGSGKLEWRRLQSEISAGLSTKEARI